MGAKTVYETALNFYLKSLNHKFMDPSKVEELLWNHVNQTSCIIENTRPWNWVYPRNLDPASRTDSGNWRKPRPDNGTPKPSGVTFKRNTRPTTPSGWRPHSRVLRNNQWLIKPVPGAQARELS